MGLPALSLPLSTSPWIDFPLQPLLILVDQMVVLLMEIEKWDHCSAFFTLSALMSLNGDVGAHQPVGATEVEEIAIPVG